MVLLKLTIPLLAAATVAHGHSLFKSRQLWATVDICNAPDAPDRFGIRGSMPSDGDPHHRMFMRFRVQYLDTATKKWVDVGPSADSGFRDVGARTARQAGNNFEFVPRTGKPAFTVRGVVGFQWRRGIHVVHSVSRVTTAGHHSLAGADPPGFSAATCTIG